MRRPLLPQRPREIREAPPAQRGAAAPAVMFSLYEGRRHAPRQRVRVRVRANQPLRALFLLFLEELQPLHHVRDARALPAYVSSE